MVSEREQDIRDVLATAAHPLSQREVGILSQAPRSTVRDVLRRMVSSGEIEEPQEGTYRMVNEGATARAREAGGGDARSGIGEHDQAALRAVLEHGGDLGLTISEVAQITGLRRRVCENTLWRLEVRYGDLESRGRPKRYRLKTDL